MNQDLDQDFLNTLKVVSSSDPKNVERNPEPTEIIETVDTSKEEESHGAPVLFSKVTATNIFRHPDAHPVVLDLLLLSKYGPEWMSWEPETIELRIPSDFKGQTLSAVNAHKIHAVNALHLVDTFWERWEVFIWCVMALNGVPPDFETMQVPTVAQVLVAVDIANRIRTDVPWSDEVKRYIQAVYQHDDIFLALSPANFVTPLTGGLEIDLDAVSKHWPHVRITNTAPTGDSVVEEQLRRLLLVNRYLEESRTHLQQQLPLVQNALSA